MNAAQTPERKPSPTRRTRQACVNCRRKKSKCPGEKPQCSICARLGQKCTYETWETAPRKRRRSDASPHRHEQDEVSRRFGSIEQKLEQLAASLPFGSTKAAPVSAGTTPTLSVTASSLVPSSNIGLLPVPRKPQGMQHTLEPPTSQLPVENGVASSLSGAETLPADVVQDGINTYFKCFHAKPYILMVQSNSMETYRLHPLVVNAMLALSIRCSSHPFWEDQLKLSMWIHTLSERSWYDLLRAYGEEEIGLQYLQGLCLLAQVDFSDGRVHRAHTQISLGIRIAQSSGYLTGANTDGVGTSPEDLIRCVWTLFMLDRTFSISRLVSPVLSYQHFQLRKPVSKRGISLKANGQNEIKEPEGFEPSINDQDLAALTIGVYSIWDDVIKYVFRANSDTMPPWQPGSELATIEYRFADFEPEFSNHRYREVDFPRRAINEPHSRPYFESWLCFQLTYMSIQCCIHHPFIMFSKLQHVIRKVPPSFLQKSYKSSLIHSRWIIRFIDEMDEAGMMLYDPFIGYLVAIAATIQLEHTLSKHSDIAAAARLSFFSALRFLRKLSKHWNSIRELVRVVDELAHRLQNRHTLYYSQDDYDGILPAVETERVGLAEDDATLMWKVFDYASMSASKGPSPTSNPSSLAQEDENFTASAATQNDISNTALKSRPSGAQTGNSGSAIFGSIRSGLQSVQRSPEANIEVPNLALFDQLPEDWAFTIDDWTLFGAPGSTYFYNEAS